MKNDSVRDLDKNTVNVDLVIVGGGLAGVCASISAAREGLTVALVQDRPVLGGNASSEVRLWALGATSHMGNNNRWAREGGVIGEILEENTFRNPEGNPHLFDVLLLDKVVNEPNIRLFLNTAVFDVEKKSPELISSIHAFCSQNETFYEFIAPLFCDASGDGIVGFRAGAAFRMGAESKEEFGEGFAPDKEYGELLGHTIFFYSKDTGKPVVYVPPSFALDDITKIPRFGQIKASEQGCALWWLEFGGRYDTIHETEKIKWELWKVVYGVWNYIKNSGKFPEAANLTLEWVGSVPGKRESRRFEGDYMMTQKDVVDQTLHKDAVAFGGWAIDLHPADGVYSEKAGCTQWHSKGVYQIPYRSLYSRNISNLFLAGRLISVSHVAFGSTRVMATTAHTAQVIGIAAALCQENRLAPRDLLESSRMDQLQTRLLRTGHYIPQVNHSESENLAEQATLSASSTLVISSLTPSEERLNIDCPRAMLLPIKKGPVNKAIFYLDVDSPTEIEFQLRGSARDGNFTPEITYSIQKIKVHEGKSVPMTVDFNFSIDHSCYLFFCIMPTPGVSLILSNQRCCGLLTLQHGANKKVAKSAVQNPGANIGVDTFEFWIPERRPRGKNFAVSFDPPLDLYDPSNVKCGPDRPVLTTNAWAPERDQAEPRLTVEWSQPQRIQRIELLFDADFDHAMETVQFSHPERIMPFCAKDYRILDDKEEILAEVKENHQGRNVILLKSPIETTKIVFQSLETNREHPLAIFRIRCYQD